MPWNTPTLEEVRKQNRDFITAHLHSGSMIPNSVLRVLADSNSGLAFLTLLYIDWLGRQFLPDTAEAEWLQRHAQIWLVEGPKPATYAVGTVTVTGIPGRVLPSGSQLSGNDIGFETTEQIVVGVAETPVAVRAITPGAIGNMSIGDTLSFTTAVAGVDGVATVATALTGGVDEETTDELRERVLERIRNPPMGGDADDYIAWTKEVPGVTRAWSYPLEMGMGTVTVRFMTDDLRADNDGFPLEADIIAVTEHLNFKRPVAVKDFFVVSPIRQEIEFTVSGLEIDDEATRAAIEASVRVMLYERAKPGQTIWRSWVSEAISQAVGEDHHTLTFDNTAMLSPGHMAVLGSIIFAA